MKYVLIIVSGGIIDDVKFFGDRQKAINRLFRYAKTIDIEKDEAGVYSSRGMLANAKQFLDDIDGRIDT